MWAVWFISMNKQLHITRALSRKAMIECQLHCLDGFRFSDENQKHNKQFSPVMPAGE